MAPTHEVDFRRLEAFLAVAETGSILGAARRLGRSQPSVTAQMRSLEGGLGAALLERGPGGSRLTEAGHRLAGHARPIRAALEAAADDVSGARAPGGILRLTASTTIAGHVLPRVLGRFRARYAKVRVRLAVANSDAVLEDVRRGRADLGLVEGAPRARGLRLEPWIDDELLLTAPASWRRDPVRAADLRGLPLLWREPGSGTRAVVERALRGAGWREPAAGAAVELGSTEAIKTAVEAGMGVAFLSRWSIRAELALGTLRTVAVEGVRIPRPFSWVLGAGALGPAAAAFRDLAARERPEPGT